MTEKMSIPSIIFGFITCSEDQSWWVKCEKSIKSIKNRIKSILFNLFWFEFFPPFLVNFLKFQNTYSVNFKIYNICDKFVYIYSFWVKTIGEPRGRPVNNFEGRHTDHHSQLHRNKTPETKLTFIWTSPLVHVQVLHHFTSIWFYIRWHRWQEVLDQAKYKLLQTWTQARTDAYLCALVVQLELVQKELQGAPGSRTLGLGWLAPHAKHTMQVCMWSLCKFKLLNVGAYSDTSCWLTWMTKRIQSSRLHSGELVRMYYEHTLQMWARWWRWTLECDPAHSCATQNSCRTLTFANLCFVTGLNF